VSLKDRAQIAAVYTAGLLQGLALVTFPAASAVLTSPDGYALSSAEYGGLFAPQAVMAIAAALIGDRLTRRWGGKRVLLLGLAADMSSMALLMMSRLFLGSHLAALSVLLGATTLMGVGFGLTVPALNTFAGALFPGRVDAAVLAMNALLGLGTALAPILVALFVGFGIWWGLPLAVKVLLAATIGLAVPLRLSPPPRSNGPDHRPPVPPPRGFPRRFWLFAAFAVLYGVAETTNANWAILYMKGVLRADAGRASLALALFWAAATGGRLLFAVIERWLPSRTTFRLLPWVIGLAFLATALISASAASLGPAAFALAGLGCSALLPLTISLGAPSAPPGQLIACYQIGYGLAAFGMSRLHDQAGLGWRVIFGGTVVIALALAALSILIVRDAPG
jgi:Major Facilitator Superfamily